MGCDSCGFENQECSCKQSSDSSSGSSQEFDDFVFVTLEKSANKMIPDQQLTGEETETDDASSESENINQGSVRQSNIFIIGGDRLYSDSDYDEDFGYSISPPDSPFITDSSLLRRNSSMTREQPRGLSGSSPFQPHVDLEQIPPFSQAVSSSPQRSPGRNKSPKKAWEDVQRAIQGKKTNEVKQAIRDSNWSIEENIRSHLWPLVCSQHEANKTSLDGLYWETVKQLYGTQELTFDKEHTPSFVSQQHRFTYYLNATGKCMVNRVIYVISYAYPDITFSPLLYPLTALLLHFVPEEECYESLLTLLNAKERRFLTQTKALHEVTWRTAMQLTRKYIKSGYSHLSRNFQQGEKMESLFEDWLWWIFKDLPFPHLVRVLDCFFQEGIKVLYRVAMGLVLLFYKHTARPDSSLWSKELEGKGVDAALRKFCREIPVTPDKLLRTAFAIRGVRRSEIKRIFLKTEMYLKSQCVVSGTKQLIRSKSTENMPTSQSQWNIQMMSHTLTIREGSLSPGARAKSMGVYPIHSVKSIIINEEHLITLWSWLPLRITMHQPLLLYTTEEHGCSLTTFFNRVGRNEPTLLVIKTTNNAVFGAYLSASWQERNEKDEHGYRQAYFGTGETFLFTIFPERRKYPWIGIIPVTGENGDCKVVVHHSAELFMAADTHMITVGGGGGQGIYLDENLRFGKTEKCATFNNPPLCMESDFEIKVLEVYGFSSM